MITTIILIAVVCGIAALGVWAINNLGTPEPLRRIVYVLIIVVAVLIVIGLAASLFGVNLGLPVPS